MPRRISNDININNDIHVNIGQFAYDNTNLKENFTK